MHTPFLHKNSFTLIEMLIVIVIIGILAAALIPRLVSLQSRARNTQRKAAVGQMTTALRIHFFDYGNSPSHLGYLASSGMLTSLPEDPQMAVNEPCRTPYHNGWTGYRQNSGYYLYIGSYVNNIAHKGYIYVNTTDKRAFVGARMEDDGTNNSFNIVNICSWILNPWFTAPQLSAFDTVTSEINNSGLLYKGRIFGEIITQ